jgi:hypothetical protein
MIDDLYRDWQEHGIRQPIFHTVRVRRDLAPSMVDHGGGTGGRRRRFRLGDSHSSLALGAIGVVPSIVKR